MARINIEERWWNDPRRRTLRMLLQRDAADQVAVNAWRTGYDYWCDRKGCSLIPGSVFIHFDGYKELIESGLAVLYKDIILVDSINFRTEVEHLPTQPEHLRTDPNTVKNHSVYLCGTRDSLLNLMLERAKKGVAGRKSAEKRRILYGTAQPKVEHNRTRPEHSSTESNSSSSSSSSASFSDSKEKEENTNTKKRDCGTEEPRTPKTKKKPALKGEALPELAKIWNRCSSPKLPKVLEVSLGSPRYKSTLARWSENDSVAYWEEVIEKMNRSDFCLGAKGWRASFDFLIIPDSALKILEGKYDNIAGPPPEVRKSQAQLRSERNAQVAEKLREEARARRAKTPLESESEKLWTE